MYKGAIFDMDGTLLDSMYIWETYAERYLSSHGIKPDDDIRDVIRPMTMEEVSIHFAEHYPLGISSAEVLREIDEMATEQYLTEVTLKPGVEKLLRNFSEMGIKMCVATLTDRHLAEAVFRRFSILGYFSELFICGEIGSSKHEPHIYRAAAKEIGAKNSEILVFEDSLYALRTAKADGFVAVGVYDKHERDRATMIRCADYYVEDISEILELIK